MARIKGKEYQPSKKEKARSKMRIVIMILILASVINGCRMLINAIAGPIAAPSLIEQYGGEEKMQQLSQAELQAPYFVYINSKMDKAKTPIGKVFGFIDNVACIMLLWKTAQWHWGVKPTVGFTLAFFWEVVFLAVCLPLFFRWKKVAEAKSEDEKPMVDLQKEMNQKTKAEEEEAIRKEAEAKKRENDPNFWSEERWRQEQERIANHHRAQKWRNQAKRS